MPVKDPVLTTEENTGTPLRERAAKRIQRLRSRLPRKTRKARSIQTGTRRQAWAARALAAAIIALLALNVAGLIDNRQQRQINATQAAALSEAQGYSAPSGFAATCLDLYLQSGGLEGEATRFIESCRPGITEEHLGEQTPSGMVVGLVDALPAPITYQDPTNPEVWSIGLVARTYAPSLTENDDEEPRGTGDGADDTQLPAMQDQGLLYFRVAVEATPDGYAMRGLPRQISGPTNDEADSIGNNLRSANESDPRVGVIQGWITATLVRRDGEDAGPGPEQYLAPGTAFSVVEQPTATGVRVTHAQFTETPEGTEALVLAEVSYGPGIVTTQMWPIKLQPNGARWEIKEIHGAPVDTRPTATNN
jgi:hypothetical protein